MTTTSRSNVGRSVYIKEGPCNGLRGVIMDVGFSDLYFVRVKFPDQTCRPPVFSYKPGKLGRSDCM